MEMKSFLLATTVKIAIQNVEIKTKNLKTLNISTVHYSTVQYSTVQDTTVQYITVHYSTLQYSTLQYTTVQYITVHTTICRVKFLEVFEPDQIKLFLDVMDHLCLLHLYTTIMYIAVYKHTLEILFLF